MKVSKLKIMVATMAMAVVPTFSGADIQSVIGDLCLIPIFHTEIRFPPEGGKIIRIGNQLFFVETYRPECANADSHGQEVQSTYRRASPLGLPQQSGTVISNPNTTTSCLHPR